jgi:methyl-accepting chemotaxis protein
MAEEERTMAIVVKDFSEKSAAYEKLLTPGYETELYRTFQNNWKNYYKISQDQLLPTSRKNETEAAGAI